MKLSRLVCAAFLVAVTWNTAAAAARPKAIDYWTKNDPESSTVIDHSAWDVLLKKYIRTDAKGLNLFDYGGVSEADASALQDYLDRLSAVKVTSLNLAEQRAYWINAYNAITVNLVIEEFPVTSIKQVLGGLFNTGPWDEDVFPVEGKDISLDTIEHGILRPIWNDPRTHYSVNCASYGCPNLASSAWTAAAMEDMLDAGAVAYINSDRGALKVEGNKVWVSSIYHWFKIDFGDTDKGVIEHMKKYAQGDLKTKLEGVTKIGGHDYSWALNISK